MPPTKKHDPAGDIFLYVLTAFVIFGLVQGVGILGLGWYGSTLETSEEKAEFEEKVRMLFPQDEDDFYDKYGRWPTIEDDAFYRKNGPQTAADDAFFTENGRWPTTTSEATD